MFRAAVVRKLGERLVVARQAPAELGSYDVRICVAGCGVNFADVLMAAGKYQEKPPLPFSPGTEVSGTVLEVGTGVKGFKRGDRVLGLLGGVGGFAEQVVTNESMLFAVPDGLDLARAAAIPVSYGTAYVGLTRRARLQRGETILVTAAAGSVGLAVIQLAKHLGATVIAAAGSAEKLELCRRHGADHVVNYREEDIVKAVKGATEGAGADVVFDMVGGDVLLQTLRCVAWEARLVVCGFASGDIPKIPANLLLVKNVSAVGLFWGAYAKRDPAVLHDSIVKTLELAASGVLQPHVSGKFDIAKANEAFDFIATRKSTGKVIITGEGH